MPIRLWNLAETASFLNLEEKTVRTLVTAGELPCVPQGNRLLFDPEEVDAWYSHQLIRHLAPPHAPEAPPRPLLAYCRLETMAPALPGRTKPAILKELTALAENAGLLYDPAEFLEALRKREELSSTAMAEGIALVHPLTRDEYTCQEPFLAVAHSQTPVFFGEPSGIPTDLFFLLCSPDPQEHLQLLAQLCQLATHKTFLPALRQATTPQEMMAAFSLLP